MVAVRPDMQARACSHGLLRCGRAVYCVAPAGAVGHAARHMCMPLCTCAWQPSLLTLPFWPGPKPMPPALPQGCGLGGRIIAALLERWDAANGRALALMTQERCAGRHNLCSQHLCCVQKTVRGAGAACKAGSQPPGALALLRLPSSLPRPTFHASQNPRALHLYGRHGFKWLESHHPEAKHPQGGFSNWVMLRPGCQASAAGGET